MRPRHIAVAVVVMAIWGLNFVVIEVGLESFPPLLFVALRYLLAAVPAVFFVGRPCVRWRWVLAIGSAIGIGQFGLIFIAMRLGMPAGLSSLVMQIQAPFTILLALLILGEPVRRKQVIGLVLALGGIALVGADLGAAAPPVAFVLCIVAAGLWALANIAVRKAAPTDMFNLIVWTSVVPPLPMLGLSLAFEGPAADLEALRHLSWAGIGTLLYLAFPATLLGWGAWGWLIRRYDAGGVAVYSLLVPIFGMLSSAWLLGEHFGAVQLIAALLVIGGVGLATVRRKPRTRPSATVDAAEPAEPAELGERVDQQPDPEDREQRGGSVPDHLVR